jgi:hypothetical protein
VSLSHTLAHYTDNEHQIGKKQGHVSAGMEPVATSARSTTEITANAAEM